MPIEHPQAGSTRNRVAALAALTLAAAVVAGAIVIGSTDFPAGLAVLACLLLALAAGWAALVRRGARRGIALACALLLIAGAFVLVIVNGRFLDYTLLVAGIVLALGAARIAFAPHVTLPPAPRPTRPVLFYNVRSGGGKAERFRVAEEARARGVEPIELKPGDDLETLVRDAIARGADALGMAGGDGSQAVVAALAAEHDLPYVCVPAGTRNHFALDLGVDRNDVVGALDAYVDGGERRVDLAEVNGRVFVNNVSLGVYAEAVQRGGYRDAKLRTLADTVPSLLGPSARHLDLGWTGPGGEAHTSAAVILVSNDPYRLGRALASGTRPRLDRGLLGIAAAGGGNGHERLLEWSAPEFEVASAAPVAAGIDGESARLAPPLRFSARPGALRVLIAPGHPGASPSATMPEHPWQGVGALARIALHGA